MKLNDDRAGRLILGLRQQGVTDPRVLAAMESIDRAVFVHEKFLDQAWEDQALPIVEVRTRVGTYDYKNKYTAGATEYLCPAPFDAKATARIQEVHIICIHIICELLDARLAERVS